MVQGEEKASLVYLWHENLSYRLRLCSSEVTENLKIFMPAQYIISYAVKSMSSLDSSARDGKLIILRRGSKTSSSGYREVEQ